MITFILQTFFFWGGGGVSPMIRLSNSDSVAVKCTFDSNSARNLTLPYTWAGLRFQELKLVSDHIQCWAAGIAELLVSVDQPMFDEVFCSRLIGCLFECTDFFTENTRRASRAWFLWTGYCYRTNRPSYGFTECWKTQLFVRLLLEGLFVAMPSLGNRHCHRWVQSSHGFPAGGPWNERSPHPTRSTEPWPVLIVSRTLYQCILTLYTKFLTKLFCMVWV